MSKLQRNAKLLWSIREIGILIATIGVGAFFTVLNPLFLSITNILTLLRMGAMLGLVAMPMALLLISGEFDISIGSTYALAPTIVCLLLNSFGVNIWLATVIALVAAATCGLINSFFVTKLGILSFVATLGTMYIYRSVVLQISNGMPQAIPANPIFYLLGGEVKNFSTSVLWLILFTAVFWITLERTKHGNWSMGTGSNVQAAAVMGINTNRVKTINFMLVAVFAGFTGILGLSWMSAVSPAQGVGLEFSSIAAAVIGGVSLRGGTGSIAGTLIGSMLLGMIQNGLILVGAGFYVYQGFIGAIVIIATILNLRIIRRREHA